MPTMNFGVETINCSDKFLYYFRTFTTHKQTNKQALSNPRHPPGLLPLALQTQPGLPQGPAPTRHAADPQVPGHHSRPLGHTPHPGGHAREGAAASVSVAALAGEHGEAEVHGLPPSHRGAGEEGSAGEAYCVTK